MQAIKEILFTDWNFMRWLRLGIAVIFIVEAIQLHDAILGFIGGLFFLQAVTNTSCGLGGCSVPATRKKPSSSSIEDAEFEEIK